MKDNGVRLVERASLHALVAKAVVVANLWAWVASTANAQDLQAADRALRRRDLEVAVRTAMDVIERGGNPVADLAAAWMVVGRAEAERGNEDASRTAFMRALALDPSATVERTASNNVRSRFLEARGALSEASVPLDASVDVVDDRTLLLRTVDVAGVVARVRLRFRQGGQERFIDQVFPVAPEIRVPFQPLASPSHIEVLLTLIDEFGNRVWPRGDEGAPLRIEVPVRSGSASEPGARADRAGTSAANTSGAGGNGARPPAVASGGAGRSSTQTVLGIVLGSVGVAALAAGVVAHVERESAARRWNDGLACTGTGTTRGERCSDELATIGRTEWIAGLGYGLGGVAIAVAIGLLALSGGSGGVGEGAEGTAGRAKPRSNWTVARCDVAFSGPAAYLGCAGAF